MQNLYVRAEAVGTIPLAEVSGLAVGSDAQGRPALLAIGDRAASVARAGLDHGPADLQWRTLDLRDAEGTRIPTRDPQLEALAADGAGGMLIAQESPNRAEFFDVPTHRVRARITLEIGRADGLAELRRSWEDESCSHAEAVVLLRDGHLLVGKEKDPVALLEFGPAGATPRGFGPDRWLGPGEGWSAPDGDATLTVLAVWLPDAPTAPACPDLSDAAVAPSGALLLLSDQARTVLVVDPAAPGDDPFRGRFHASAAWQLAGIEAKPEGIAVLPEGDVLIACDRRKVKTNLFVVRQQVWAAAGSNR